jgi:predicted DNA-binding transcriptional regulator AlpA
MQSNATDADDPFMDVRETAAFLGLSIPSVWRNVADLRLPQPAYPAPKAPRWRRSWLLKALEESRQLPRDAMAARRQRSVERRRAKAETALKGITPPTVAA